MSKVVDPLEPLRKHQDGHCGMCKERKLLIVDHDHDTMLVRGYLCRRCNTSEGASNYPWILAYRANPPAAQIGLVVRYGQHLPQLVKEKPARPRRSSETRFERWCVMAAQRPDLIPDLTARLTDDPEMAGLMLQFGRMLQALGHAQTFWAAEAAAEKAESSAPGGTVAR